MERAFRAIRRSDVVALVIDAVDGITQQDFRYCPYQPPGSRYLHNRPPLHICVRPAELIDSNATHARL